MNYLKHISHVCICHVGFYPKFKHNAILLSIQTQFHTNTVPPMSIPNCPKFMPIANLEFDTDDDGDDSDYDPFLGWIK